VFRCIEFLNQSHSTDYDIEVTIKYFCKTASHVKKLIKDLLVYIYIYTHLGQISFLLSSVSILKSSTAILTLMLEVKLVLRNRLLFGLTQLILETLDFVVVCKYV
jgi:hypothetical protein